jgi:plasmid stabilization system protein ParE
MILLSPEAVEDVQRLRTFLDQKNPDAAQRALAVIWTAIDRLQPLGRIRAEGVIRHHDVAANGGLRLRLTRPTGYEAVWMAGTRQKAGHDERAPHC